MIPLGRLFSHIFFCGHKFSSALNALVWEGLERERAAARLEECSTFTGTHDTRRVSPEELPETVRVTP